MVDVSKTLCDKTDLDSLTAEMLPIGTKQYGPSS
jgi:hypothetical protein